MFQFSIRQVLSGIALVAFLLGILMWLHRALAIDEGSEVFLVNGEQVAVPWKRIEWEPGRSGIRVFPREPFTIKSLPLSDDFRELDQELFEYYYTDHFGNRAFRASVQLWGHVSPGETSGDVLILENGGGNTDGGCLVELGYDDARKTLNVGITQWVHRERIAKEVELQFHFDGRRFCLVRPFTE